jgi:uncharacterized membrane protein
MINSLISIISVIFLITSSVLTGFNMGSVDVEEREKFNLANLIFISLTILLTITNHFIKSGGTSAATPTVPAPAAIVSGFGKMLKNLVRGKGKKGKGKGK